MSSKSGLSENFSSSSRYRRGAKMDLIKLANQNAREEVERATTHEERSR